MKVGSKNKQREVVFEQTVESEAGFIAEMIKDPIKLDGYIPGISSKAKALAEANSDETPEFPIVRAEEGRSGNGRVYDARELDSIARQVNELEPVGHWGHINPLNMEWEAPEPQTTWLGAITKDEPSTHKDRKGEIVRVFYAAGYNLPGAKIRTYIKSKAVRAFSWAGQGKQIPIPGGGVQVRDFKLNSIDWARKLSEGMPTASIVGLAREMKGAGMDKELSQVTPEEFKEENPNAYSLIVKQAQAEKDEAIAEMATEAEALKAEAALVARLREVLGLDAKADVLEVVANLLSKSGEMVKGTFEKYLDKVLGEKVPDESARRKVRRLVVAEAGGITEMEKYESEEAVSEMLEELFNSDEDIQEMVSEMSPAGRNLGSSERDRGENSKSSLVTGNARL